MLGLAASRKFGWRLISKPDEELIADALGGESAAFSELATRHRPRVERLCQRFFSDPEIARDLAQECFDPRIHRACELSQRDAVWRMAARDCHQPVL